MFVSYSEAVASAFALAQGGAERRRSGFDVDVVGWHAGAVMAGVVVARDSTRFSRGGSRGEEERSDGD